MKSIDKMSLSELRTLNEKVSAAIETAKGREKDELRRELLAIAERRGFAIGDLFGAKKQLRQSIGPKFRDPISGATWAGRGRMPRNFDRSRAEALR